MQVEKRSAVLCVAGLLLVSCSDNGNSVDSDGSTDVGPDINERDAFAPDEGQPDSQTPWVEPFAPAVCKTASYRWLDPRTMGEVTFKERSKVFSYNKEALTTLLGLTDFADAVTIKYGVSYYVYRYETQNQGQKVEATAMVTFPDLPEGETLSAPLVLWLHGTTGFSDQCAPSRGSVDGILPVVLLASQGYIGVAPDYLGMNGVGEPSTMPHPFVVGEPTAIASLDAVRGAKKIVSAESATVSSSDQMIVWGASQGGHAALFSLRYAPHYTPELELLAGLVLLAPVDMVGQAANAMTTLSDGTLIIAGASIGMSRWYGYEDRLAEVINDAPPNRLATELPTKMEQTCQADIDALGVAEVSDLFTEAFIETVTTDKDWTGFEQWRCMFDENAILTTSVKHAGEHPPILFVVSERDKLLNAAIQRQGFDKLCAAGYQMEYIECVGAGHTDGAIWSLGEQFAWLADRFDGKPLAKPCIRQPPSCCKGSPAKVCTP